jgi:hypothetical protein
MDADTDVHIHLCTSIFSCYIELQTSQLIRSHLSSGLCAQACDRSARKASGAWEETVYEEGWGEAGDVIEE